MAALGVTATAVVILAISRPGTMAPAEPTPAQATSPSTGWAARYAAARGESESGRPHLAFAALAELADEGHCEAARDALLMVEQGRAGSGLSFRAGPKRLWRWQNLRHCAS